jgi:hypothetical protein
MLNFERAKQIPVADVATGLDDCETDAKIIPVRDQVSPWWTTESISRVRMPPIYVRVSFRRSFVLSTGQSLRTCNVPSLRSSKGRSRAPTSTQLSPALSLPAKVVGECREFAHA